MKTSISQHIGSFSVFCLTFVLLSYCSVPCKAGVWRDNFNDGDANGWQVFTPLPTTVEVHNRVLDFRMHPNAHALANHLLEWTAVPFEAASLTVETKFPDQVRTNFGIALGRRTSHKIFGPLIECYAFLRSNRVVGIALIPAFAAGIGERGGKAPRDKRGGTIGRIRIVFKTGRFQMFAEDKLMADFSDDDFQTIDAVGVFARTSRGVESRVQIANFVISGPSIPDGSGYPVKPGGTLSTTWGHVKKKR
jgi:hypothetical protein